MPRYSGQIFQGTVSTAYKSLGYLYASSGTQARRMAVYEMTMGLAGALNTSNDTQVLFDVTRFTTTSLLAGTAMTPSPLDGADPATLALAFTNITTEIAAFAAAGAGLDLLNPAINQRGTYRWRALDDGDNLIIPATNLSGLAVRVLSLSYTGTAIGSISYLE